MKSGAGPRTNRENDPKVLRMNAILRYGPAPLKASHPLEAISWHVQPSLATAAGVLDYHELPMTSCLIEIFIRSTLSSAYIADLVFALPICAPFTGQFANMTAKLAIASQSLPH